MRNRSRQIDPETLDEAAFDRHVSYVQTRLELAPSALLRRAFQRQLLTLDAIRARRFSIAPTQRTFRARAR